MAKKTEIEQTEIEAPYELPEGWKWCNWGDIGTFVAGNGFKEKFQGFTDFHIPFYKVGSLKYSDSFGVLYDRTNTINDEMRNELKANLIPECSIIFAKIGEAIRLNRRSLNSVPCCIDNNLMAFIPNECDYKYVFYWSKSLNLYDYTNATTVPAIRKSDLEKISFPLPPTLEEQQRIVARIETLFAKLDEAKEKAQTVVDTFETRKAAILHQAFTGHLTAPWRQQHNISDDSWEESTIGNLCKLGSGGTPSKSHPEYYENGTIPWLNTGEIDWNDIYSVEKSITQEGINNSSAKLYPAESVVVAMYGMGVTRGKSAIIKIPTSTNQAVCVLQPNENLYNRFLFYYFMSNYWIFREKAVGGNQLNYSATMISKWNIQVPSLPEQQEIVRILDTILEKETKAKEAATSVLDQIDLLKKSILARAFRGEL